VHRRRYAATALSACSTSCPLRKVLDMGSRRILGFALGENHNAELAYQALVMAVTVRGGRDAIAG
jgi:putative transposase